ncbi:MAG: efflux RND transporter periplasmic adaptor subunit [Candidatus Binatia bacterium]|nr:efflux RND transporter periplasmic adaptor subunit [Candidatus Binatia bacterium]
MRIFPALALLILLISACGGDSPPQVKPGTPVEVATSRTATVPLYLDALGRLAASDAVNITPQVSGQLLSAHFKQGSRVEKGQLLFRIDPRKYTANLQEAAGRLEQAVAELTVRELELARNANLAKKDFVSKQQYDRFGAEVAEAEGSVLSAQGSLATAEINLAFTEVRAPIAGIAGLYQTDVGNIVTMGGSDTLTTIESHDPLWVDIGLPGSSIGRLTKHLAKAGGQLTIEVRALGSKAPPAPALLSIVDNRVSDKTGTVTLRATLDNSAGNFWPGQPVQTRTLLQQVPGAILVPQSSVGVGQAGPFVFVVEEDKKVRQQSVTLGQTQGKDIVVLTGLKAGVEVVTTGRILLSDQAEVRIETAPTPTPGKNKAS